MSNTKNKELETVVDNVTPSQAGIPILAVLAWWVCKAAHANANLVKVDRDELVKAVRTHAPQYITIVPEPTSPTRALTTAMNRSQSAPRKKGYEWRMPSGQGPKEKVLIYTRIEADAAAREWKQHAVFAVVLDPETGNLKTHGKVPKMAELDHAYLIKRYREEREWLTHAEITPFLRKCLHGPEYLQGAYTGNDGTFLINPAYLTELLELRDAMAACNGPAIVPTRIYDPDDVQAHAPGVEEGMLREIQSLVNDVAKLDVTKVRKGTVRDKVNEAADFIDRAERWENLLTISLDKVKTAATEAEADFSALLIQVSGGA